MGFLWKMAERRRLQGMSDKSESPLSSSSWSLLCGCPTSRGGCDPVGAEASTRGGDVGLLRAGSSQFDTSFLHRLDGMPLNAERDHPENWFDRTPLRADRDHRESER